MFTRVLVANRGEIAVRVIRALHELGVEAVAVYSTADAAAMHVRMADQAVCVGPPPASESYLRIPSIIADRPGFADLVSGGLTHAEAVSALGMASAMLHMSAAQRAVYARNKLVSLRGGARLRRQQ